MKPTDSTGEKTVVATGENADDSTSEVKPNSPDSPVKDTPTDTMHNIQVVE